MNDFLKFFNEKVSFYPMELEISRSSSSEWSITISQRLLGPEVRDKQIIKVCSEDMELCFAKAHVQLKEWLLTNCGGY